MNKKTDTTGNRKLIATLVALACIMIVGYTLPSAALMTVVGGIVSVLGLFLTGNIIRKYNARNRYRDNHNEDEYRERYN